MYGPNPDGDMAVGNTGNILRTVPGSHVPQSFHQRRKVSA